MVDNSVNTAISLQNTYLFGFIVFLVIDRSTLKMLWRIIKRLWSRLAFINWLNMQIIVRQVISSYITLSYPYVCIFQIHEKWTRKRFTRSAVKTNLMKCVSPSSLHSHLMYNCLKLNASSLIAGIEYEELASQSGLLTYVCSKQTKHYCVLVPLLIYFFSSLFYLIIKSVSIHIPKIGIRTSYLLNLQHTLKKKKYLNRLTTHF